MTTNIGEVAKVFVSKTASVLGTIGKTAMEIVVEVYKNLEKKEKFYWILMQLEWPPITNESTSLLEISELVDKYESHGLKSIKSEVSNLMLQWHSNEYLLELVDTWNGSPILKSRMHILRPCLQVYLNADYTVVIPALLAQIEGIVASGFRFTGRMNGKVFVEHLESLLHEAMILKSKNHSIQEFVTNVLMAQFIHGDSIKSKLSRNAILHGADLSYGTQTNSLKLILLIENLRKLFRFEAIENAGKFHFYGCHLVRKSKKRIIYYSNVLEAQKAGLNGCRMCGANHCFW